MEMLKLLLEILKVLVKLQSKATKDEVEVKVIRTVKKQ
jgi:hypothetical protein